MTAPQAEELRLAPDGEDRSEASDAEGGPSKNDDVTDGALGAEPDIGARRRDGDVGDIGDIGDIGESSESSPSPVDELRVAAPSGEIGSIRAAAATGHDAVDGGGSGEDTTRDGSSGTDRDGSPDGDKSSAVTGSEESRELDDRSTRVEKGREGSVANVGATAEDAPSAPLPSPSSAGPRRSSRSESSPSPRHSISNPPLKVLFLSSDTGGGHRASAESLANQFLRLFPGTSYRLLDVVTECGVPPYNSLVGWYSHLSKNPAQWSLVYRVSNSRAFQAAADVHLRVLTERAIRRRIASSFVGEGSPSPDVVISVHPLMCAVPAVACANLSHESGRHVPFFTVVTDLGSAHAMWFDKHVEKMFLASQQLRETAMERGGVEEEKIVMTGLPIRRDFAVQAEALGPGGRDSDFGRIYQKRVRDGLGLFPGSAFHGSSICPSSGRPKTHRVLLVMGGGEGCGALGPIVDALYLELVRCNIESTVVVVCGRNEALRKNLEERDWHGVMARAAEDQRDGHDGDEEGGGDREGLGRRAEIARRLRRIMSTPGRMESEFLEELEAEEKANEEFPAVEARESKDSGGASASANTGDEQQAAARKRTYSWGLRQVLNPSSASTPPAADNPPSIDNDGSSSILDSEASNKAPAAASAGSKVGPESEEWLGYRAAAARRLRRAREALSYRSLSPRNAAQNGKEPFQKKEGGEGSDAATEPGHEEKKGIEVEKSEDGDERSDEAESVREEGMEVVEEQQSDAGDVQDVSEASGADEKGDVESVDSEDAAEVRGITNDHGNEGEVETSGDKDRDDDATSERRKDDIDDKDEQPDSSEVALDLLLPESGEPSDLQNKETAEAASRGDNDDRAAGEDGTHQESEGSEEKAAPSSRSSSSPAGKPKFELPAPTAHVTVHPLGFVKRMAEYMVAADLLISKAGPGTIAEAASVGLPVLLTSFLPGQEEGNVDFVIERGFGAFVPDTDPRGVANQAACWLSDAERLKELGTKARDAGCPNAAEDIVRQIGQSAARWKELNEENAHAYAHARQVLRLGSDLLGKKEGGGEGEGEGGGEDADGSKRKDEGEKEGESNLSSGAEKVHVRTLRELIRMPPKQGAMETEPSVATDVSLTSIG